MKLLRPKKGYLLLLAFLINCTCLFAQKAVTGKVTNKETGAPVEGATIAIKGSKQTTATNEKGEFTLNVPSDNATLVISYVGMARQERKVGDQSTFNFVMTSDNNSLDDVVVVGYGTQKRTHLTGAVATVNVKDIEDIPTGSLAATLQGRMAGVAVSGGTSRPGSNAGIVIRKPVILSKDGGTLSPLYVIDDVIRDENAFNILDATEVESISVLKDAAAAIYGIAGAQGVVVVKTRRGQVGKPKFTINSSVAFNDATQQSKMMDGYQLASYLNSSLMASKNFVADGSSGYLADAKYYTPDELEYFKNNNFNWLDNAWKSSMVTRHAINVSGGTDRATFFAGASYFYQNGNLDKISNDKWTFRASADVKVANGLKVGINLNGNLSSNKQYLLKQGGTNAENDVRALLYTPGFSVPYVNGFPVLLSPGANQNTLDNLNFFEIQRLNNYNRSTGNGMNIMANITYEVPFIKGLSIRGQYSKTLDNIYPKEFGTTYKLYKFPMAGEHSHIYAGDPIYPATIAKNGDRIYIKPSFNNQYQLDGYLNYNRKFGNHEIGVVLVAEQAESIYNDVQTTVESPTEGAPDIGRFAFGVEDIYETQNETGRVAYFGRINYNYASKYLVELQLRNDYSAKFAPEYRSGYFPSASIGWVLSEEKFFKKISNSVNYLKLRSSIGLLGSDNTKAWPYLQRYTPNPTGGPVFGGNNGRIVGTKNESIPNRATQWDDNTKFNVGLDARFLKNKLSATIEYYYDYRYNMLTALTSSVPLTVGSTISSENYSTVAVYGTEISLGWKDNIGRDFNYNINGFFTWNDGKNIKTDVASGDIGTYLDPTGKSLDMGYLAYEYLGMFRSQADVDAWLSKNPGYKIQGKVPEPGMLYYKDVRGPFDAATKTYGAPDGVITDADMDYIRNKAENHFGYGLSIGAGYKGFRLDMVISGSFGGVSAVEGAARKLGTATSSRPAFWADNWTPENSDAMYPNPYQTASYDVASAFWLRSSFQCRMRNLNLSYGLSPRTATKIGFSNLKVYMSAINPINFYNPYDYKDNALGSFDTYPNLRTFSFGINATL